MKLARSSLLIASALLLAGCSNMDLFDGPMVSEAHVTDHTRAEKVLNDLPQPAQKIPVVAYDFLDQTGQFKENGAYAEYSSAVTKGGYSILIKALLDAGNDRWFTVAERGSLKSLLQERQIIKLTRDQYTGPNGQKLGPLPPMTYGGMMIEGGIISYDSNIITGGAGAAYLGISATAEYHRDLVTVYLRAVNIQNGEVLLSVTSSKTIYSAMLDANLLKYLTIDNLFQSEAGITLNEPTQFGVRQAVETAVYSLIMEGTIKNLWHFADPVAGDKAIRDYIAKRDGGTLPPEIAKNATKGVGAPVVIGGNSQAATTNGTLVGGAQSPEN